MSAQTDADFFGQLGDDAGSEGLEGGEPTDQTQDGQQADGDAGQGDDLPTDPEALKAELLKLRKEAANAQALLGRQGDELGQYRAAFEAMQAPGAPETGVQGGPAPRPIPGAQPPAVGQQDEYSRSLAQAQHEYASLLGQGYTQEQASQVYLQRMAQANQAEIDRRMLGFVQHLQSQQTQFANFEKAFFGQHPELEDARARRIFDMALSQQRASGMHRNPVDAYEAAQKQTVELLTAMGYEAVEEHEAAKARGRKLAAPGGRGAAPSGGAPTPSTEQVIADLGKAYAKSHLDMQRRLKRPSEPVK